MYAFLEEKHEMVRKLVKQFSETELTNEILEKVEETAEYPEEILQKMAKAGLFSVKVPIELGGQGADVRSYAVMGEEISKVSAVSCIWALTPNSLAGGPLLMSGSKEQKEKYLKPILTGEKKVCFALTEPGAGSDAGSMTSTAIKEGEYYILNGRKTFITMAPLADYAIVYAKTDPTQGTRGISGFVVDMTLPGVSTGKPENKMGVIGCATSDIILENVKVHKSDLLGQEGKGLANALATLDVGRIGSAAMSVGVAQACLDEAIKYSKERKQFGRRICDNQAIAFTLAEMATKVETARLLTYQAAWLKDQDSKESTKMASMAKYYASEICNEIASKSLQIHGGYGYMKEYKIERMYRDCRVFTIFEGTTEVQKMVISRALTK